MRFFKVFALLIMLGAVAGAVAGLAFAVALAVGNFTLTDVAFSLRAVPVAAIVGAVVGALLGPPIALSFLRHVPLWRATIETAAGASLGFALSSVIAFPFSWIPLMLMGALLAAVRLNRVYKPRKIAVPLPNEELKPTATPSSLVE